jgi:hypothetical protein
MRIKISRVITFEYELTDASYPDMSAQEIVEYERGMDFGDVLDAMANIEVNVFTNVETYGD